MITTSGGAFVLAQGDQTKFSGSSIVCKPTYLEGSTLFAVELVIQDSATTNVIYYGAIQVTKTEVDAQAGTGTGEVAQWFSALQIAVKVKLEAITDNSGVTFTVV